MVINLEQKNAHLKAENARLHEKNKQLEEEKRVLQLKVDALIHRIFGRRSERFDHPDQGRLFEDEISTLSDEAKEEIERSFTDSTSEPRKRSRRNGRRRLPKNLERERVLLDLSEEEKTCEHGHRLQEFGQDVSEEVDIIPAKLFVRELTRPKYKNPTCCHPECQGVKMAPLPARPIEKGRPAPGLLSHIAVAKYSDHIPLYRQEQIFQRHGIDIHRSTMCDWMGEIGYLLDPICRSMKDALLASGYLQADETPIRVQGIKKGKMHKGYLWGYGLPWGEVVYDFSLDRSHRHPLEFLDGFEGLLQIDGYDGYNPLFRDGTILRFGCMAHARRKFFDACHESPSEVRIVLAALQKLYRIDRDLKALQADPEERRRVRQEKARPILDDLKALLEAYRIEALPKSKLGEAITYALNEWAFLERYVDHGEVEIDNNSIEHTMRPVALGRKNYLFAGSENGGKTAATLYSLITTCKRLDINPWDYLKDVLERISTHPMARVWELTPRGWKETRQEHLETPDDV